MSDDSSGSTAQALKCSECDAKISADAIDSSGHVVCEYCGALIVLPRSASPRGQPGAQPPMGRAGRSRVRRAVRGRRPQSPLLRVVKLLLDKGVIDEKTLRDYTKQHIGQRIRAPVALRRALRQMRDEGKLDRKEVFRAVDELVTEQKLPPRARDNIRRLLD